MKKSIKKLKELNEKQKKIIDSINYQISNSNQVVALCFENLIKKWEYDAKSAGVMCSLEATVKSKILKQCVEEIKEYLNSFDKDSSMVDLYNHCTSFIDQNDIGHPESIYQNDKVIEDAYSFIEGICDIVGYKDYK